MEIYRSQKASISLYVPTYRRWGKKDATHRQEVWDTEVYIPDVLDRVELVGYFRNGGRNDGPIQSDKE
jgi:hypothetical protein